MVKTPNVILLIESSREYGRGLLRGIARYARIFGPWNIYREPEFYLQKATKMQTFIRNSGQRVFDGIIMREQSNTEDILALGIPTIIASYRKEDISNGCSISVNCAKIGQIAAKHFLQKGFKHFAYCGYDFMYWSRRRQVSFVQYLEEAGHKVNLYKVPRKRNFIPWQDEQPFVCNWLKSLPKPVAIFTCNDDRGSQIIDACRVLRLNCPDDVAVLGVDNDEFICNLSTPSLSSIPLNTEKAGFEAAEILSRMMAGEIGPDKKVIISEPMSIVNRQSTDILAVEDQEVAKAVRFIRQNADIPVQVADVVERTNLSRCGLYLRFQKAFGYSVHDEIKRMRVERIAKLLLETDMSISQIALKMGFADLNHVARYFKNLKGLTPLAYRKKYRGK